MKYKVGDKVRIRSDLYTKQYGDCYVTAGMSTLAGQVVTIKRVFDNRYHIEEYSCNWTDEMFEAFVERPLKSITKPLDLFADTEEAYAALTFKDKETKMKTSFKIKEYKVCENNGKKTVVVTFSDNTEQHAVCCVEDKFDLERGVEVCVMKYLFGADKYKATLKDALRQIKNIDKAAEKEKEEKELIARKKAKAARRKERTRLNRRKRRIDEMTEAYYAAMKKYGSDFVPNETFVDDAK